MIVDLEQMHRRNIKSPKKRIKNVPYRKQSGILASRSMEVGRDQSGLFRSKSKASLNNESLLLSVRSKPPVYHQIAMNKRLAELFKPKSSQLARRVKKSKIFVSKSHNELLLQLNNKRGSNSGGRGWKRNGKKISIKELVEDKSEENEFKDVFNRCRSKLRMMLALNSLKDNKKLTNMIKSTKTKLPKKQSKTRENSPKSSSHRRCGRIKLGGTRSKDNIFVYERKNTRKPILPKFKIGPEGEFPYIPEHYQIYIDEYIKWEDWFVYKKRGFKKRLSKAEEVTPGVIQQGLKINNDLYMFYGRALTKDGYYYYGFFRGGCWEDYLSAFLKGIKIFPGAFKAEFGKFKNGRLKEGKVVMF